MEIHLAQLFEAYGRITRISHYHVFIISVIIDITTGYVKAIAKKDLDSQVGLKGILKHLSVVGMVFLICPYLWLLGYESIALFLLYSITITYVISFVENVEAIRPGTFPAWLGELLRRTKKNIDTLDIKNLEDLKDKRIDKD